MKYVIIIRVVLSLNVIYFLPQYPGLFIFLFTVLQGVTCRKTFILNFIELKKVFRMSVNLGILAAYKTVVTLQLCVTNANSPT